MTSESKTQPADDEHVALGNPNFTEEAFGDEDEEDEFVYDDMDDDDLDLNEFDEERMMVLWSVMTDEEETSQNECASRQSDSRKTSTLGKSTALVPTKAKVKDDEDDIGSDEEREIMKEIRDEIENKVRGEMKEELEAYDQRLKALGDSQNPNATDDLREEMFQENEDKDPKLKEAIEKMNKLDKLLRKKVRKEKEVKRDRILLERRMRDEISQMQHGASNYKEIKVNTEKYLALEPPPSHNAGVKVDENDDDDEMPPLFQTQIDDAEVFWKKGKARVPDDDETPDIDDVSYREGSESSSRAGSTRSGSKASKTGGKGKQKKKDFIKRNRELAADAAQVIAMTDDEKKRLQDLLHDVDEMPELTGTEDMDSLVMMNAFQITLPSGEGFCPDKTEMKSLTDIDARLKTIMPEEDFLSITHDSSSAKATPQPPLFSRVGMNAMGEIPERFGERVLYETKEERDLKDRLHAIEKELDQFKNPQSSEPDGQSEFHLTDEQLDSLLDQCARSISRLTTTDETPDLSARSVMSSRQALIENPPKLTEEQLQQLLSEAHFPLSSTLLSLRDDDQKIEEEQGNSEAITAETWKAINEVHVSERDQYLTQSILSKDREENFSQNASSHLDGEDFHSNQPGQNSSGNNLVSQSFEMDNLSPESSSVGMPSSGGLMAHSVSSSLSDKDSVSFFSSGESVLPVIGDVKRQTLSRNNSDGGRGTPSSLQVTESTSKSDVYLPEIKSNSFLVQTAQGLNNSSKSVRDSFRTGPPLNVVHNDLSESQGTFSTASSIDSNGELSQRKPRKHSNGFNSPLVPRPPTKESHAKNSGARQ